MVKVDNKQTTIFDGVDLEGKISQRDIDPRSIKTPKLWGVRRKDIELLGYDALEMFFYGFHNIKIPVEMLNLMNPDEIYSKFIATGSSKRYHRHTIQDIPKDFIELVKFIDRIGYGYIGFMANKCKRRFSSKPGAQEKRLGVLEDSVKERFVNLFFEPYKSSNREQPSSYSFLDPNTSGRNKKVYVDEVYKFLNKIWCNRKI